MEQDKVTMTDFSEFIKYLIELGNVYTVDDDWYVLNKDGDPVGVVVNKKPQPLIIFHEGMKIGDYKILNPFTETLGHSPERHWFFTSRSTIACFLVRRCIETILTLGLEADTKDLGYDKLEYVTPIIGAVDAKMLKEFERIKSADLFKLFYHKKQTTAQVQTRIFEEEFQQSFKPRIRIKTWNALQGIMGQFFKTMAIEDLYKYKSNMIGMQECDATLTILYKVATAMETPVKVLMDVDLDIETFTKHIDHLVDYHKLSRWMVTGTQKETEKETLSKPPWETSILPDVVIPNNTPKVDSTMIPNHYNQIILPSPQQQMPSYSHQPTGSCGIVYAGQHTGISYARETQQPIMPSNNINWTGGGQFIRP